MIKSQKLLWCGSILTVAFLVATFFVPAALASADATTDPATTESIETEAEELGVKTPGRFFWLRQWRHNIQKAITFNPVKKAEIDLTQASEQLLRARQIAANSDDPELQEKIGDALEKYEKKIAKIKERAEKFRAKAPEQVDKFLDKLTDRQFKQQEIMSKLEEKIPERALEHLKQIKEKTLEHYSDAMDKAIANKAEIAERISRVIEAQGESDFNRLKHIEVLKRLESKVPEQAKAAIIRAQENILDKFKTEVDAMPEELRKVNYQNYIEKARMYAGNRLDVLESITEKNILPSDIKSSYELIKREHDLNAEALKKGIENLSEAEKYNLEQIREQTQERLELQHESYNTLLEQKREILETTHKEQFEDAKEHAEDLWEAQKRLGEKIIYERSYGDDGLISPRSYGDDGLISNDSGSTNSVPGSGAITCPQLMPPAPHLKEVCEAEGGQLKQKRLDNGCMGAFACVK